LRVEHVGEFRRDGEAGAEPPVLDRALQMARERSPTYTPTEVGEYDEMTLGNRGKTTLIMKLFDGHAAIC
jgi:hypothetical protein